MVPTPRGTARRLRSSSARLAGPGTSPSSLRACGRVTLRSFTETVGGPPPLDAPASLVAPSSPAAPSSLLSPAGARRRPTSLTPAGLAVAPSELLKSSRRAPAAHLAQALLGESSVGNASCRSGDANRRPRGVKARSAGYLTARPAGFISSLPMVGNVDHRSNFR